MMIMLRGCYQFELRLSTKLDKTKLEFAKAEKEIKIRLTKANEEVNKRISDSEKRGIQIIEDAKQKAEDEKNIIIENSSRLSVRADGRWSQARPGLPGTVLSPDAYKKHYRLQLTS